MRSCILPFLLLLISSPRPLLARDLSKRARICSQNLDAFSSSRPWAPAKKKIRHLVGRFARAKCDVIALQEAFGYSKGDARERLRPYLEELKRRTDRSFKPYVAYNFTPRKVGRKAGEIYNAFLVAADFATVAAQKSYWDAELPRLHPLGPNLHFSRGPFELRLGLNAAGGSGLRWLRLITMHFKSMSGAWKDPSGTSFELLRMAMAEGLRDIALRLSSEMGDDEVLVVLGDRNSDYDSPSSAILQGRLRLRDFIAPAKCSIAKSNGLSCRGGFEREPELLGLFAELCKLDKCSGGTFKYRKKWRFLDEILLPVEHLKWVKKKGELPYSVFKSGRLGLGSDHKLIWTELAIY